MEYKSLSAAASREIENNLKNNYLSEFACRDETALRRTDRDGASVLRPPFIRDCEKILHSPYYSRYHDKTQVFSFYKNDDLTRRALHVQLVSRIARNIGRALGLNLELIEAISLGHDLGHTPFGHAGERILSGLYRKNTGRYFKHNVQSVRLLDSVLMRNLTLQTLDGILCHNGEFESVSYSPSGQGSFEELDGNVRRCLSEESFDRQLMPMTLEGCVVRISDIIAYIGKDRQDAERARISTGSYSESAIGDFNAVMINNLTVDIIESSLGKAAVNISPQYFEALKKAKEENNALIYKTGAAAGPERQLAPLFSLLYDRLLADLSENNTDSFIFRHHIDFINNERRHYGGMPYGNEEPDTVVADYIACMTDDYFMDLCFRLFPEETKEIKYISYFE